MLQRMPTLTAALKRDLDLEQAVFVAWRENLQVPTDRLSVAVRDGVATLMGRVNWRYQSVTAATAAAAVAGVRAVDNRIVVEIS